MCIFSFFYVKFSIITAKNWVNWVGVVSSWVPLVIGISSHDYAQVLNLYCSWLEASRSPVGPGDSGSENGQSWQPG